MSPYVKTAKYNGKRKKKKNQQSQEKGLRNVGLGRGLQNELRISG